MQERRVVAALSRPSRRARLVVAVVAAAAVVAADQVTKSLALDDLHRPVHLLGPLGLALQYNTGSAFSLFTGDGTALIAIAGLLAVAVGWLAWRAWSLPVAVAAGLVLGGAVGNLVDRVSHGRVVDFITLSHWPTFNVADSCITVGVVLVALLYLRGPEVPAGGPEALPTTTPAGGPEALPTTTPAGGPEAPAR